MNSLFSRTSATNRSLLNEMVYRLWCRFGRRRVTASPILGSDGDAVGVTVAVSGLSKDHFDLEGDRVEDPDELLTRS